MERLGSGKTSKKAKADIERKHAAVKRHLWHVEKLEQMVRMIDNDAMDVTAVDDIKEDVEF